MIGMILTIAALLLVWYLLVPKWTVIIWWGEARDWKLTGITTLELIELYFRLKPDEYFISIRRDK